MPLTPNMRQIAEAAGVSKSAVSLALRDDPRMAKDTRDRIQRIAKEMGYKKNNLVATLMSQLRSPDKAKFQGNLALFNCSTDRKIFGWNTFLDFKEGMRQRADQMGYGIEEFWVFEPGLKPERLQQILNARSISGIIFGACLSPGQIFPGSEALWAEFSMAVVGIPAGATKLPSAMNNHYQTVQAAMDAVAALGYTRPALVLHRTIDRLLDRRFTGAFLTRMFDLPEAQQLMPFEFADEGRAAFLAWFRDHRPDVILTLHEPVLAWLREAGLKVPGDVSLVHLDRDPRQGEWAGMEQNNLIVGAAVADLVINQIHRREMGRRENPKLVLIDSEWVAGPSCVPKSEAVPSAPTRAGRVRAKAG